MKIYAILLFLSFCILLNSCSKDDSDSKSGKSYKLTVSYSSELGNVSIDPLMDSYPSGTIVKVIATPKEGNAFEGWEINSASSVQKEMAITIDGDILLKANFVKTTNESYSLKASCEASQGSIDISPKMDSYPMGTKVQIKATAKEGYKFSKWEGLSSTDANINIDITQNLDLKAVFVKDENPNRNTSDLLFEMDIKYNKDNVWTAKANLTDKEADGIKGAVIKVNNQQLTADDFFIGEYTDTIKALNPDEEVTVTLELEGFSLKTYKVKVPPAFTQDPSLTGAMNKGVITVNWESVNCSEYILTVRIENTSGSRADITVSNGTPLTATTYSTTVLDIFNSNVRMTPTPSFYTIWVSPANTIGNLEGLNGKSYIKVTGKNSNGITNKPKQ